MTFLSLNLLFDLPKMSPTAGAKSSDPNRGGNTHDFPPRGHNKPAWTHVDSLHLNQKCFVFLFLKCGDSSLTLVAKCSVLSTS